MANKAIASEYTAYAQALRRALLVHPESGQCHERAKAYLLALFKDMDENGDGVLSVDEFKAFVQSLRLTISEDCVEQDPEKFADILVQQIDINQMDGDGGEQVIFGADKYMIRKVKCPKRTCNMWEISRIVVITGG